MVTRLTAQLIADVRHPILSLAIGGAQNLQSAERITYNLLKIALELSVMRINHFYCPNIEFDRVIVAGVNQGVVPLEYRGAGTATADPVVRRENEIHERSLLYVAATRAKKEALITSFGHKSPFL